MFLYMDFQYVLDILLKRKWLILCSVIVPAIALFLYVSSLDRVYKSYALISTGILGAGFNPEESRNYVQERLIAINFGNRLEKLQGPSMVRLLSYEMLIHDLKGEKTPFRKIGEEDKISYSEREIQSLIKELEIHLDTLNTKVLPIEKERIFKNLAEALEYDYEAITDNLAVYRRGDTDNIAAEFKSEDPYLSAFLVNTLIARFLELNKYEQQKEYSHEFRFAQRVALEKKEVVDSIKINLNNYKREQNVVDLGTQSAKIVESINKLEEERASEESRLRASEGAIFRINQYLNDENQEEALKSSQILNNEEILQLRDKTAQLYEEFSRTGNEALQFEIDNIEKEIERYLEETATNEKENIALEKDSSLKTYKEERLNYEIEKIKAENSIKSIDQSLALLRGRKQQLVKDNTELAILEADLTRAEDEHKKAQTEMTEKKKVLDKSYQPLTVEEYAQIADKPESSKRLLFTAFGGVLGGAFCIVSLLMLTFFDTSLNSPHQFKKFTNLPLVGTLNELKAKDFDLIEIFNSNGKSEAMTHFKESIRTIRYAMEQSEGKTFLFTSTQDQSGKTFLMITLAYALTLKKKKVLLIDTNFKNNTLTQMSEKTRQKNLLTTKLIGKNKLAEDFESKEGVASKFSLDHVDIIGNRGGYSSPSEIFAGKDFQQFVEELGQSYDYIFLEGAALNKYADTRELIEYSDKIITVFSSDMTLGETDKLSMDFLQQVNGKMLGAVLNKLDLANIS